MLVGGIVGTGEGYDLAMVQYDGAIDILTAGRECGYRVFSQSLKPDIMAHEAIDAEGHFARSEVLHWHFAFYALARAMHLSGEVVDGTKFWDLAYHASVFIPALQTTGGPAIDEMTATACPPADLGCF